MSSDKASTDSSGALERLSNQQIAIVALYQLGGVECPIDSEAIAVKCYELAPRRFSWKTRDHPNLAITAEALNDARRPRNGALISGNINRGWRLTAAGVDWIRTSGIDAVTNVLQHRSTMRPEQISALEALISNTLFSSADLLAQPPTRSGVASAVSLLPDAPIDAVVRRINELETIARHAERADVERYLQWLRRSVDP